MNVTAPDDAVTVVVPPSVPFAPLASVAVTDVLLSLVTALPYASTTATTGCSASTPPGAPPDGCVETLSSAGEPASMVNPDDVPVSEPLVLVAERVLLNPAVVTVTECAARTPAENAEVMPEPDEIVVFNDDTSAVPVKFVTVRPPESLAVIFTANDDPAVCVPISPPPAASTVNDDRTP